MTDILLKRACELLGDKMPFVIASIIGHEGSTPRVSGTKMIIAEGGEIAGTIGGGLLEARVMERASELIRGNIGSAFMPFDLSHEDVASMDMICGGRAEIFLDLICPTDENIEIFNRWRQISDRRQSGYLITAITGKRTQVGKVFHGVMYPDGQLHGILPLTSRELQKIPDDTLAPSAMNVLELKSALVIAETSIKPNTAFLFGAGHVAKPTAHLCAMTGFYVTVLDDRQEFANTANFPDSHEVRVLDSFEHALDGLHVDNDSFIVIFTRGHLHDRTVLAQALTTDAGYIGMIGSRKKRDSIYKALINIGFEQADIDRVHSPIGLKIGAQSPEEIAVSIVAEMIKERAMRSK